MTILLVATDRDLSKLRDNIAAQLPDTTIALWPEEIDLTQVTFAVLWKHPPGLLANLSKVKLISSLGAGVETITRHEELPPGVPVCRIVDPSLSRQMAEYVIARVLAYVCRHDHYHAMQLAARWQPKRRLAGRNVAVIGMGEIGRKVAEQLQLNHFDVRGWNTSGNTVNEIPCNKGIDGLIDLCEWADFVVCILPVTPKTTKLFDDKIFKAMKNSAIFINVGRGALVDDNALIQALNNDEISAACIDVFTQEPLVADSALWHTERLTITPHISAITDTKTVVDQLVSNYKSVINGGEIANLVDLKRGY